MHSKMYALIGTDFPLVKPIDVLSKQDTALDFVKPNMPKFYRWIWNIKPFPAYHMWVRSPDTVTLVMYIFHDVECPRRLLRKKLDQWIDTMLKSSVQSSFRYHRHGFYDDP